MVFGFSLLESRRHLVVNVNAGRLHLISRRCRFMALGRLIFSTGICNPIQWSKSIHYHRRVLVDTGSGSMMAKTSSRLRLRSCLDHCDGAFRRGDGGIRKASAMAPYTHLLSDSHEVVVKKEVSERARTVVNGNDSSKHNGVPIIKELVVAVDVDEVLGSFLAALNKFIADRYSLNHSLSEYYVYEFFKIWNCSRAEADIRVHEFFKTSYFKTGIHPIPGARHTLHKLHAFCKLSVVTSRQNAIKDQTLEWIEKHFPGLFQEIHFGNHFALDGKSRPKSEICRSFGAQVLIDDNPRYAIECAEAGIKVLLFDYDNSYPWCKSDAASWHPLVTRVHNWQEVEQQLVSWAVS